VQNDVQLNHRDEEGRSFLHLICNSQMNVDRTQVIFNILTQVAESDLALDISAEDHRRMKPVDYLKRQKKMDQNIKDKLIQLFDVIAAPKKTESTTANPTQINNIVSKILKLKSLLIQSGDWLKFKKKLFVFRN
jgi:hypothetical protein